MDSIDFTHHHSQSQSYSLECYTCFLEQPAVWGNVSGVGGVLEKAVKLSFTKKRFGLSKAEDSWCFQLCQELWEHIYTN